MDVQLGNGKTANRRSKPLLYPAAVRLREEALRRWPDSAAGLIADGDSWRVYWFRDPAEAAAEAETAKTPRAEAERGQVWLVRVCGRHARVRLRTVYRDTRGRRKFEGMNEETCRSISGDALRLRRRVS